jgi:Do/DeqQ family serine protease
MKIAFLFLAFFGYAGLAANFANAAETLPLTRSLAPMLEMVVPGVVSIEIRGTVVEKGKSLVSDPSFGRSFGAPEAPSVQHDFRAWGSGIVIEPGPGYILTNNHVVEGAETITVCFSDGRCLRARRIGVDPPTDLAVLQVLPADHLTSLPLGDSDALKVGDYVVAIGNPYQLGQTVTFGIVSALGRTGLGIEGYEDFIQTDASINPGNSGGPLVNLKGEVVGINSAIIGPSSGNVGIGLAIPINMARIIMEQLIVNGEVPRGRLGVTIQDLTPKLASALHLGSERGAIVDDVIKDSAAENAGIKPGDVIIRLNDKPVSTVSDFHNDVGLLMIGSTVRATVLHEGKPLELTAALAAPKTYGFADGGGQDTEQIGVPADIALLATVVLGPVRSSADSRQGQRGGAVILQIDQGTAAENAGLKQGDVIQEVNQKPVQSPQEAIAAAREGNGEILLRIVRGGRSLYIVVS